MPRPTSLSVVAITRNVLSVDLSRNFFVFSEKKEKVDLTEVTYVFRRTVSSCFCLLNVFCDVPFGRNWVGQTNWYWLLNTRVTFQNRMLSDASFASNLYGSILMLLFIWGLNAQSWVALYGVQNLSVGSKVVRNIQTYDRDDTMK